MSTLPTWMYGDPVDVAQRNEAAAGRLTRLVLEEVRRPRPRVKLCLAVKRARIRALVAEVMRTMGK
jgi:hypothetical protein